MGLVAGLTYREDYVDSFSSYHAESGFFVPSGAFVESGFVFGPREQWDIGVRISGGYPYFEGGLLFGWAVL
jgi:hypothetical protein